MENGRKPVLQAVMAAVLLACLGSPAFASGGKEDGTAKGKILVVYYSATGNTERVAKDIAEATGADLFELEPKVPYTSADLNWRDKASRVNKEHDDPSSRTVELASTQVPGWEGYSTVFIGYPIWWGDASWVLDGFVKENDFSGKTVIPFCTSSSSPLGDSGKNLAAMAGSGKWEEGKRFSSRASSSEVSSWAKDQI